MRAPADVRGRVPLPGETWRHRKSGRLVRVLHLARMEATGETHVAYEEEEERGVVWLRPLAAFLEVLPQSEGRFAGAPRFEPEDRRAP